MQFHCISVHRHPVRSPGCFTHLEIKETFVLPSGIASGTTVLNVSECQLIYNYTSCIQSSPPCLVKSALLHDTEIGCIFFA